MQSPDLSPVLLCLQAQHELVCALAEVAAVSFADLCICKHAAASCFTFALLSLKVDPPYRQCHTLHNKLMQCYFAVSAS